MVTFPLQGRDELRESPITSWPRNDLRNRLADRRKLIAPQRKKESRPLASSGLQVRPCGILLRSLPILRQSFASLYLPQGWSDSPLAFRGSRPRQNLFTDRNQ